MQQNEFDRSLARLKPNVTSPLRDEVCKTIFALAKELRVYLPFKLYQLKVEQLDQLYDHLVGIQKAEATEEKKFRKLAAKVGLLKQPLKVTQKIERNRKKNLRKKQARKNRKSAAKRVREKQRELEKQKYEEAAKAEESAKPEPSSSGTSETLKVTVEPVKDDSVRQKKKEEFNHHDIVRLNATSKYREDSMDMMHILQKLEKDPSLYDDQELFNKFMTLSQDIDQEGAAEYRRECNVPPPLEQTLKDKADDYNFFSLFGQGLKEHPELL